MLSTQKSSLLSYCRNPYNTLFSPRKTTNSDQLSTRREIHVGDHSVPGRRAASCLLGADHHGDLRKRGRQPALRPEVRAAAAADAAAALRTRDHRPVLPQHQERRARSQLQSDISRYAASLPRTLRNADDLQTLKYSRSSIVGD